VSIFLTAQRFNIIMRYNVLILETYKAHYIIAEQKLRMVTMDNRISILQWVSDLKKTQKQKPAVGTVNELIDRIKTAKSDGSSINECVAAVLLLNHRQTLPLVYEKIYYGLFPEDIRHEWDDCIFEWAEKEWQKDTSAQNSVVLRLTTIFHIKLIHEKEYIGVLRELQWFSRHKDKKLIKAFSELSKQIRNTDLLKLLDLNIRDFETGKDVLVDLYCVLSSQNEDQLIKCAYQTFLERNNLQVSKLILELSSAKPEGKTESAQAEHGYEPAKPQLDRHDKPVEIQPESEDELYGKHAEAIGSQTGGNLKQEEKTIEYPVDNKQQGIDSTSEQKHKSKQTTELDVSINGVALAEKLVAWAQEKTKENTLQQATISQQNEQLLSLQNQIETLTAHIKELTAQAEALTVQNAVLTRQTDDQLAEITILNAEKNELHSSVERVQKMLENTIQQKLDGSKTILSKALKNDIEDLKRNLADEELSPSDKLIVLQDIITTILRTLNLHGIATEG